MDTDVTPQIVTPSHNYVKWVDVEATLSKIEKIEENIRNVINLKGSVIREEFLPDIMKNIFEEIH